MPKSWWSAATNCSTGRRSSALRDGDLSKAIESFLDLRNGDLVVHLAHGIGRYRGLKLLDKDGHVEEHLELEFHGGTRIYVPSSKIELVQKYVGARKIMPRLATIGGKNWLRQKKAAEAAVEDLAADLLQLQAEREAEPGDSFRPRHRLAEGIRRGVSLHRNRRPADGHRCDQGRHAQPRARWIA